MYMHWLPSQRRSLPACEAATESEAGFQFVFGGSVCIVYADEISTLSRFRSDFALTNQLSMHLSFLILPSMLYFLSKKFQIYIFILLVQVHGHVYWHPLHVLFTSLPSPWSGISAPRRCLRWRQTEGSEVGGEGRTQPLSYHRAHKWEHHVMGNSVPWLN